MSANLEVLVAETITDANDTGAVSIGIGGFFLTRLSIAQAREFALEIERAADEAESRINK